MRTIHDLHGFGGSAFATSPRDPTPSGFGEWLEQLRRARGLTLDDIRRETKISLRHLEALEHGNLGFIPPFYRRAEVRAIARVLGVDERLAVGRLDMAAAPMPESSPEPKDIKDDAPPPWAMPVSGPAFVALAFVVTLAAAGIGQGAFSWTAGRPPAPDDTRVPSSTMAPPSTDAPEAVSMGRTDAPPPAVETPTSPTLAAETPGVVPVPGPTPNPMPGIVPASSPVPGTDAAHGSVGPPSDAATAASLQGELVVTTVPEGARVTVNGISWGISPVTIRHLPPGDKRIRATKEGFGAAERVFVLESGRRQTLSLRLDGAN